MNPEQLLDNVAALIEIAAKSNTGKIHVVRQGLEIRVLACGTRTSPVLPITSYDAEKARAGLTVSEWTTLSRRLAKAVKEIEKCKEQSKP